MKIQFRTFLPAAPVSILAFIYFTLPAGRAEANPADSYGFGAAGVSQAGARVSMADDWTSAYFNMAGMAAPPFPEVQKPKKRTPDYQPPGQDQGDAQDDGGLLSNKPAVPKSSRTVNHLGMAYMYQAADMHLDVSSRDRKLVTKAGQSTKKLNYGIVNLGFVFDLRSIFYTPYNLPIKLGGAMAVPNGSLAAFTDTNIGDHKFIRLGREAERMMVSTGLAAQVWPERMSIGLGATYGNTGRGKMRLDNILILAEDQVPDFNIDMEMKPTAAPVAGIMYRQPLPGKHAISAGFSYRGEVTYEVDPISGSGSILLLQVDVPLELALLDFYTPHRFTTGVSFALFRQHIFSLEWEHQLWSQFRVNSARERVERFTSFNDIAIIRFAYEWQMALGGNLLTPRAGYGYVPAFTPQQTGLSNFLDNDKHVAGLGVGYRLGKTGPLRVPTTINLGLQSQFWVDRTNNKTRNNPFNPDNSHGGTVYIVSLSVGWSFKIFGKLHI